MKQKNWLFKKINKTLAKMPKKKEIKKRKNMFSLFVLLFSLSYCEEQWW